MHPAINTIKQHNVQQHSRRATLLVIKDELYHLLTRLQRQTTGTSPLCLYRKWAGENKQTEIITGPTMAVISFYINLLALHSHQHNTIHCNPCPLGGQSGFIRLFCVPTPLLSPFASTKQSMLTLSWEQLSAGVWGDIKKVIKWDWWYFNSPTKIMALSCCLIFNLH